MYTLKLNVDLKLSGQITDKVKLENNKLIISNDDNIELREDGWYINNVYQGKDASYVYKVENPIIINQELFNTIFEKIEG